MRILGWAEVCSHRTAGFGIAGVMGLMCPASWAVLGGDLASVQTGQTSIQATRQTTLAAPGVAVHEIRMADGSSIREFVNAQGIVYAVAWSTRMKPDFTQMLGRHAIAFNAGVTAQPRKPGLTRNVAVDRDDLVVHSAGRPGAFVGRAWLKSLLPAGARPDAIR